MLIKNSKSKKGVIVGTEFQLHKTQLSIFSGMQSKIIDYSEHKLRRCILLSNNSDEKNQLSNLLEKYKKGWVAISWKSGVPHWLNVTKDLLCTETGIILQLAYVE